jgi:hypothetical protein
MPRESIAGALEGAQAGLRGRYAVDILGAAVRVTWQGEGFCGRIEDEALGRAVSALRKAGYQADRAPGFPWVMISDAAALIGADEPGIDHEHGRDSEQPMAAE